MVLFLSRKYRTFLCVTEKSHDISYAEEMPHDTDYVKKIALDIGHVKKM